MEVEPCEFSEINIEGSSISIDLICNSSGFTGGVSLPFSDLDFSDGALLTDVSLTSNFVPESRFSFTDSSISLDLSDLPITSSSFINLGFVPEPSVALLMGVGLAGIGVKRRFH